MTKSESPEQPRAGAPDPEEEHADILAYLIESVLSGRPSWYSADGPAPWTNEAHAAIWFLRREDAERVRATLNENHLSHVTEHIFGGGLSDWVPASSYRVEARDGTGTVVGSAGGCTLGVGDGLHRGGRGRGSQDKRVPEGTPEADRENRESVVGRACPICGIHPAAHTPEAVKAWLLSEGASEPRGPAPEKAWEALRQIRAIPVGGDPADAANSMKAIAKYALEAAAPPEERRETTKELQERYAAMGTTPWFREAHEGRPLGDTTNIVPSGANRSNSHLRETDRISGAPSAEERALSLTRAVTGGVSDGMSDEMVEIVYSNTYQPILDGLRAAQAEARAEEREEAAKLAEGALETTNAPAHLRGQILTAVGVMIAAAIRERARSSSGDK